MKLDHRAGNFGAYSRRMINAVVGLKRQIVAFLFCTLGRV